MPPAPIKSAEFGASLLAAGGEKVWHLPLMLTAVQSFLKTFVKR